MGQGGCSAPPSASSLESFSLREAVVSLPGRHMVIILSELRAGCPLSFPGAWGDSWEASPTFSARPLFLWSAASSFLFPYSHFLFVQVLEKTGYHAARGCGLNLNWDPANQEELHAVEGRSLPSYECDALSGPWL